MQHVARVPRIEDRHPRPRRRRRRRAQLDAVLYPPPVYPGLDIPRDGVRVRYGVGAAAHYRGAHDDCLQNIGLLGVIWDWGIT